MRTIVDIPDSQVKILDQVSKKKNALQYLVNKLKENGPIELYDNGDVYRDYIYVDDVVDAINLIIKKGSANEIYNIGNDNNVIKIKVIII